MKPLIAIVLSVALLGTQADAVQAQRRPDRFPTPAAAATDFLDSSMFRPLRVAKWGTAALAVGLGIQGFLVQGDAEERYEALQALCVEESARCSLNADGTYTDPELERRYSGIADDYATARWMLVGSQVALIGSIVLFVLDLREGEPENIPYDPDGLLLGIGTDGSLRLGAHYPLHLGAHYAPTPQPVSNISTRSP